MKKIIAYLLLTVMLLSLAGCGEKAETVASVDAEETFPDAVLGEGLNVGYGKVNITPDYNIGIGGYGDTNARTSKKVLDEVYITCIAFTENNETILVFTLDNCACSSSLADELRSRVSYMTKIPAEKQFYGATHTHSAPSVSATGKDGQIYKKLLLDGAVRAAKIALSDRAPAASLATTQTIEGMNFVRHYKMADGTVAGSNFGSFTDSEIVGHTAEPDTQMILLKFDRAEKADILMVNWQAHPDHSKANGYYNISADFPGAMRAKLEEQTGMHVAYFTGASGNLNPFSKIEAENHDLSMKAYGQKLADQAIAALNNLQSVEGSGIAFSSMPFAASIDHSWDHMLEQAKEAHEVRMTQGVDAGHKVARSYGFSSVYQASVIVTRAELGPARTVECNAFRVGGIGFVNAPYEMFSQSGEYIKENSPFDITFIITGNNGYIPSADAFDYDSYEAVTGYYAKGTAEALADHFLWLLELI